MFNASLLREEVQQYLRKNYKKNIPSFILKASPFPEIRVQDLAVQLKGLRIAEKKFPLFFHARNILYPPKLNLEQTSSEITANYKAEQVAGNSGMDLTGGFGIDSYFLSRNFHSFDYCEINNELAAISEHNFRQLGADNIRVFQANGLEVLDKADKKYDWIFADPARRSNSGGKVFKLEDCEPDIPKNLGTIFKHTDNLLVKTSPILDLIAGMKELKSVREIHIVAVRNEVKELLWILEKEYEGEVLIKTLNFEKEEIQEFTAKLDALSGSNNYAFPQKYLYEPNASIMKSGLFEPLAHHTDTKKLHINSHLFTSNDLVSFPGRIFEILEILSFRSSEVKKRLKSKKANITTRNFPESVENLRKKFKVKDGGDLYVFFTTNKNEEKIALFCKKV